MGETANTSHTVKPGIELELHYTQNGGRVTIHKLGCKHGAETKRAFAVERIGEDDWFEVAPCARGRKG